MTPFTPWLVIPMKPPVGSKQRLAATLPDPDRELLSGRLSRRAIRLAAQAWPRGRCVVVTPDGSLGELAAELGLGVLVDAGAGQTAAVRAGAHWCLERGAEVIATLAADLPQLTAPDLESLRQESERLGPGEVLLLPDLAGTGTNGMAVRPGSVLLHAFGSASLERHRTRARLLGLGVRLLLREGLARDVDRPADLPGIGPALLTKRA